MIPKISIVMPVYNVEKYVRECLLDPDSENQPKNRQNGIKSEPLVRLCGVVKEGRLRQKHPHSARAELGETVRNATRRIAW